MKKLLVFAVLIVVGYLAYTWLQRGPSGDARLLDLEERLRRAESAYAQASRGAAMSGLDTTSHAESALHEIDAVAKDLSRIEPALASPEARAEAERLERDIEETRRRISGG